MASVPAAVLVTGATGGIGLAVNRRLAACARVAFMPTYRAMALDLPM
jgi:NAD(P)-dependent dehydrogenase (short-subunit alcohol dehydrogenase family)